VRSKLVNAEKVPKSTSSNTDAETEEVWIAEGRLRGRICARLVAGVRTYVPLAALQNLGDFESIIVK
jgi:hypothetical protein